MSTPADEYATDITDAQWGLIEPLRPTPTWHPGGPPAAGSTPDHQGPFVSDQNRLSLGSVAADIGSTHKRVAP